MSFTSRTDRKPDPSIDRDRALAALIFCAKQHPDKTLGQVINLATQELWAPLDASDADIASAFRTYSKES